MHLARDGVVCLLFFNLKKNGIKTICLLFIVMENYRKDITCLFKNIESPLLGINGLSSSAHFQSYPAIPRGRLRDSCQKKKIFKMFDPCPRVSF